MRDSFAVTKIRTLLGCCWCQCGHWCRYATSTHARCCTCINSAHGMSFICEVCAYALPKGEA